MAILRIRPNIRHLNPYFTPPHSIAETYMDMGAQCAVFRGDGLPEIVLAFDSEDGDLQAILIFDL
jgi:hypothetical protein